MEKLTRADYLALSRKDGYHFCFKGVSADLRGDAVEATEYYRLGAILGDRDCFSNLAVSYDTGRGAQKNLSLALAYFQIAAQNGSLDAITMLARNYRNGKYGEPDPDTAAYYLRWGEKIGKRHPERLKLCQFFCEDLAKAKMPGGILPTDLVEAHRLLRIAAESYSEQIEKKGYDYLQEDLEKVQKRMEDPVFDDILGRKREAQSADDSSEGPSA